MHEYLTSKGKWLRGEMRNFLPVDVSSKQRLIARMAEWSSEAFRRKKVDGVIAHRQKHLKKIET